ncbi:adenylate/guanylate cyclase domain-containing protein [Mycobacterium sp. shizuoka-1]|uniref:adenylate/guanylate cyclase domain-containing protein n=1 Tax=Mycobacterium sp. shizuoka-1 TaxID=2039281 RepID=UPI000C060D14|nr:adenylate/guanylate cyclase domain-containing protein [Mycobacterium sp. shizuoka-1]GAY18293.1 adenylate cyclase [Mycobacterium sp. shizuoka-1]
MTPAQRGRRVLEWLTQQSAQTSGTPEYGSWLLGRVSESQRRRRVRIQIILTVFVVVANLIGVVVAMSVITVAIPVPNIFAGRAHPITTVIAPAYVAVAVIIGWIWATRRLLDALRWSIEGRPPSPRDQRNTFRAPWRLTVIPLVLWGVGAALLTTLYGLVDTGYIPKMLFGITFSGIVVSASCYFFTEFALRPVAAQALEIGTPTQHGGPGVLGRTIMAWVLGSCVPVIGIALAGAFTLTLRNMTVTQLAVAVLLLAAAAAIFGFILILIASWLIATPVQVVRSAMQRVEDGDLDAHVVVFDGTELGELQRGFNAMVEGLRERDRVRDLFGRHVGRDVALAAEQRNVNLGGEECRAAVIFVDIVGSTQVVGSRPPVEVVELLNRFFAVVVDEVERYEGLVNKFEGDGALAVFGAPVAQEQPESNALAAARALAARLRDDVPEIAVGIGVAAGTVVAGNIGSHRRFEYTVIGDPVHEAARLCELAKKTDATVLASATAVAAADRGEQRHWTTRDEVVLRGRNTPTRLAYPVE